MRESDTILAILNEVLCMGAKDEGEEKGRREDILVVGEERLGMPDASIKEQLSNITDLDHLTCVLRRAVKAASWQEIVDTPSPPTSRSEVRCKQDTNGRSATAA